MWLFTGEGESFFPWGVPCKRILAAKQVAADTHAPIDFSMAVYGATNLKEQLDMIILARMPLI